MNINVLKMQKSVQSTYRYPSCHRSSSIPQCFIPEQALISSQIILRQREGVFENNLSTIVVLRPVELVTSPQSVRIACKDKREKILLHRDLWQKIDD